VFPGDGGVFRLLNERGADLRVAIGGDAHADTAFAEKNAEIGLPLNHFLAGGFGIVRVIDGFRGESAEIGYGIAFFGKGIVNRLFEFDTAVISGHGDAQRLGWECHGWSFRINSRRLGMAASICWQQRR